MTIPGILFGILIATVIGVAFHIWRGGNFGRLLLFIFFSWVGFWAGHFLGEKFDFTFGQFGMVNLVAASLGSLTMLFIGNWMTKIENK